MAWRYKEWGGIRKAETEVVRIKWRRRDRGGRVGEAKSAGWEDQPPLFFSSPFYFLFARSCMVWFSIV
jgi:hypothetical protein